MQSKSGRTSLMMGFRASMRSLWNALSPSDRETVLRRARREVRRVIREHEGASRVPTLRVWITADLFASAFERMDELAIVATALTAYAAEVASERQLTLTGRVDARILRTRANSVVAEAVSSPRQRTERMPRRIASMGEAAVDASVAIFDVEGSDDPLEVSSGSIIGRLPGTGVMPLNHARISAKHLRVEIEKGAVYVVDLGSSNGSFVGTNRLVREVPTAVPLHKTVRLGDVTLRLLHVR